MHFVKKNRRTILKTAFNFCIHPVRDFINIKRTKCFCLFGFIEFSTSSRIFHRLETSPLPV